MIDSARQAEFNDRIVRVVTEHWDEHKIPMLLSQLGNVDGGEVARLTKQDAGGLAAYLQNRLAASLRVVRHSTRSVIVGTIPVDAELPGDGGTDEIDALLNRTLTDSTPETSFYNPAFWAAFRIPLDESKRRYVRTEPPFRFQDLESTCPPPGHLEVGKTYIASTGAPSSDVQNNVQRWLSDNEVDPDLFLTASAPGAVPRAEKAQSNNLLDRLLSTLGRDDLKRISMPLDIVGRLRRERL